MQDNWLHLLTESGSLKNPGVEYVRQGVLFISQGVVGPPTPPLILRECDTSRDINTELPSHLAVVEIAVVYDTEVVDRRWGRRRCTLQAALHM